MGAFANSEDPDAMLHNEAFHKGLHCLIKKISIIREKKSHNLTSTTVGIISADELRRYQNEDQDLAIMVQSKSVGVKPSRQDMVIKSPACWHYWIFWDSLVLLNGILYKKFLKRDGTGEYIL